MPALSARRPRGFTLVELMIALTLVGIVSGTLIGVLIRQQRFFRATSDLIQTRSQIRQAVAIIPQDLRGVSSAANDIVEMRDSVLDFWATVGTGVVCQPLPVAGDGTQEALLVPLGASRGPLTNWLSEPRLGDRAALYDTTTTRFSQRLELREVASGAAVTTTMVGCSAPLLTAADLARPRPRVRVKLNTSAVAAAPMIEGSPIRFLRRVRYSLYRPPGGTEWYLGYREYDASGNAGAVQPVSGPYRPYAADTTSGLTFSYFDANGNALGPAGTGQVARVNVVVRALTNASGTLPGMASGADGRYADYDQFTTAIRNRW